MAITTTNRKAGPYLGNGVAVLFPFNFKVFRASDLYVVRVDANGAITVLALNMDFAVMLNPNQDMVAGGAVTLYAPLAVGSLLTITSDIAELQGVILTNLGGFYPEVLNAQFDRLTILIQQLQNQVDQSLKFGLTDDLTTAALPPAAQRAGKMLMFGSDGAVLLQSQPATAAQITSEVPAGAIDGGNNTFTLAHPVVTLLGVFRNGIKRLPSEYAFTGSTTFGWIVNAPIAPGESHEVLYIHA